MRAKKGDIFRVFLSDAIRNITVGYPEYVRVFRDVECGCEVRYFQYLMLDPAQLNSEVIRVFGNNVDYSAFDPNCEGDGIKGLDVDFYAHVVIKWGIQMRLWEKVANFPIEPDFSPPYFRICGDMPPPGPDPKFGKSENWYVWKAGQRTEQMKFIGRLTEEYKELDDGMIRSPISLVYRLCTGSILGNYFS